MESIGHYVGFAIVESKPALWSQRIPTVTPNAIHRKVVASALIRFEMYRFQTAYDLLISSTGWKNSREHPSPYIAEKTCSLDVSGASMKPSGRYAASPYAAA